MIVVLKPGTDLDAVTLVEAEVRRAGGEPRRLTSSDARLGPLGVASGAPAQRAVECRQALTPEAISRVGAMSAVAYVLDGDSPHPKVGRAAGNVQVGRATLGGAELVLLAGPCAVESEEQLEACAVAAKSAGAAVLRGGAYKPRTSPYSFQGHREEGLRMLRAAADRHGLAVVTEVLSPEAVAVVAEHADMLQIGSRNMQNFALLRAVGKSSRPVLLKRGMSATLEEWLLAAEYIADGGNEQIVFCERGVRSFDAAVRNLLDLSAVPLLRERTKLPIVVDPSHGVGIRSAIPAMALAAAAAGADGIMLECHPDPGVAKSDGFQALLPEQLVLVAQKARAIAALVRG